MPAPLAHEPATLDLAYVVQPTGVTHLVHPLTGHCLTCGGQH